MGLSCTKVKCRTPWCESGLIEKYYLESNGKHPRHEALQYWHFTMSDNIYTYTACDHCILKCPCINEFTKIE